MIKEKNLINKQINKLNRNYNINFLKDKFDSDKGRQY